MYNVSEELAASVITVSPWRYRAVGLSETLVPVFTKSQTTVLHIFTAIIHSRSRHWSSAHVMLEFRFSRLSLWRALIFWDVTLYSLVEVYRDIWVTYCLHLQCRRLSQAKCFQNVSDLHTTTNRQVPYESTPFWSYRHTLRTLLCCSSETV
jgi:hypothetical protein